MAPRAENLNEPSVLIKKISASLEEFKSGYAQRLDVIESAIDRHAGAAAFAALGDGGLGGGSGFGVDPSYSETFKAYVRNGEGENDLRKLNGEGYRAQINAAMSVGTSSGGGYLAPTEWDRQVRKAEVIVSPLRRLATVMTTGVGAFSTVWNNGNWGSGWVGETATRPDTTSPTLATLDFPSGEIYSNVPITQRLLDDAEIDIEGWLSAEVGTEFARQEGIAFLSGNGTNKPFGLLTYVAGGAADGRHPGGNLTVVQTAGSGSIASDDLVSFAYSLPSPYRLGATWLMNSATAAAIARIKDGQGNYIWREAFVAGQPATLLGYPVEIDEGMPNVGASALAVAFGNFARAYLINDRLGMRLLRDPYSNKPFVNFYSTKRVGGGVLDPIAVRLLQIKP
jgi:HK97 family phage major capsid protein